MLALNRTNRSAFVSLLVELVVSSTVSNEGHYACTKQN